MSALYDLGRNAGQAAGQADTETAEWLRDLTDQTDPEQARGFADGQQQGGGAR